MRRYETVIDEKPGKMQIDNDDGKRVVMLSVVVNVIVITTVPVLSHAKYLEEK